MEAWVLDSSLSAGQVIYACVGNSSITTFQGGSTGAAWNSNYLSVWHLPNGSSLTGTDSTTNANNGSPGNSPTAIPGQIDGGAGFTAASNQYILGSETINSSAETLNVWVYVPSIPSSTAQVAGLTQGNGAGTADHVLLITGTQGHPSYYVYNSGGVSTSGSSAIPTSQWVMLTGSVGAAGQFIYVNGVQQGFSANTAGFTGYSGPNLLLGGHNSGSSSASTNLTFNTDELELAKVQLSANWIATEFNNQSAPSSFMTWALVF